MSEIKIDLEKCLKEVAKLAVYVMCENRKLHFEAEVMKVIDETTEWNLVEELKAVEAAREKDAQKER